MNIKEITVQELKNLFDENKKFTLLDVREPFEVNIAKIEGSIHIPMGEVKNKLNELDLNDKIIVQCKSGVRSARICEYLVNNNFKDVKNLKGGIVAWSQEIDNSIGL